jgi:hypothetical protein
MAGEIIPGEHFIQAVMGVADGEVVGEAMVEVVEVVVEVMAAVAVEAEAVKRLREGLYIIV